MNLDYVLGYLVVGLVIGLCVDINEKDNGRKLSYATFWVIVILWIPVVGGVILSHILKGIYNGKGKR